ncbi:hypothetical protein HanXRQr2_Chr09g0373641 [Helianthus annuus]|uniref:Uncharacterized protein n=1 Tax=Helianthus annuus TaxID=4232 RepID=A0A9K3N7W1_HELAN|nr:hypothetical protein HanXRQr2_Chr09g0373641 [Helianthus annuus]KAJ0891947.1 hypothetical protein HanPSC8_Chr09g0360061 [Helianthus annuus]
MLTTNFMFIHQGFEPGVFLEAASLSIWIEVRFAYFPPSSDPTNNFAIYETY